MRRPSINPRQRKAAAEGERQDWAFFRAHADRQHHSRRSLPLEFEGWAADAHEQKVTVSRRDGGLLRSFAVVGLLGNVPDHESFLALLWAHIEITGGDVSPVVHLQLAKAAGLVDERIGLPK